MVVDVMIWYCTYVQSIWWSVYIIHTQYLIGHCPVHIQSMWLITILNAYRAFNWSLSYSRTKHLIGHNHIHIQSISLVSILKTNRVADWSVYSTHTEQMIGHHIVHMYWIWCSSLQQNTNHCHVSAEQGCLAF